MGGDPKDATENINMAIDLEAIKRKIAQLEGKTKGNSKYQKKVWFKPKAGNEYCVRILPFEGTDGQPFKEIWSYQNIGEHFSLPTLRQYKERDPFAELIDTLREENTPESLEMAKKLYPKMRAFAAVIIRGEEDKGPQVWGFGKTMYQAILEKMMDSDFGDVTDVEKGFDLKVTVKQVQGKSAPDYTLCAYPTDKKAEPSPLSTNKAKADSWLASVPDLNDLFKKRDYDEMKGILEGWLGGSDEKTDKKATGSVGLEKTKAPAPSAGIKKPATASPAPAVDDVGLDSIEDALAGLSDD